MGWVVGRGSQLIDEIQSAEVGEYCRKLKN